MPSSANSSARVLLADPEEGQRNAIAAGLAAAGYRVEVVPVDATLNETLGRQWDVLILDISAAGFLKRAENGLWHPILILMTESITPEDAIMALQNLGADACLEKPVHIGVLAATLASLLRRVGHMAPPPAFRNHREAPRGGEENNVWKLSPTNWTITCPRGGVAKLTRIETDFLLQLAREPGASVARDQLIGSMGHNPDIYDTRRLDTFVSRLRSKVSNACANSLPLRSVHAVGYAFAAPILLTN